MLSKEIREKFLKFFESKGHTIVPSSSLLPTDPSVLFTTAGMQQFKPYYTGAADASKDFGSLSTVSIQKSMRTSDIDEVGDLTHLTFFEMLGNFSFGGYWKKEAIEYAHEFVTKEMGLKIDYVSVFGGDSDVPADEESEQIWKSIDSSLIVKKFGRGDNFWGPTGNEGPCGPTTEIYVNGVEIWNVVFNQYFQHPDKKLEPLKIQGIDTGMGLERLAAVAQNKNNIFETDLFEPLIQILPEDEIPDRTHRIISDHSRAAAFLICDGVTPSNKDQGYVLRRLMRRVIVQCHVNGIELEAIYDIFEKIVELYGKHYPELDFGKMKTAFIAENDKFQKTFKNGLKEMEKLSSIDGTSAFKLYESFGLPFEVIQEVGKEKASGLTREAFEEERKRHQEISRAGAEKKFGGHGIVIKEGELSAENQEELKKKTRLHTATHIVVAALEKVLGEKLIQAGSDINTERLRFDFKFSRKVTPEELKQAEKIANEVVEKDLPVSWEEVATDEAFSAGASGAFRHKYGDRVKVYTIGDKNNWFSKEICGGPHVTHSGEVGHITITKEESVSGGNRRIRATVD
ncbi:alanine--tRNA ligase [Candidatus Parcubacteria bacterium]|nr:alanine--tRNA ligase [Candidatus Parcubacteria bacterium]